MSADAKPVSATRLVMAQEMTPQDANPAGNVHGGNIMRLADSAAGVVAIRHSGRNCVTAAVDHFEFHAPVFIGNLVTFHASVNVPPVRAEDHGVTTNVNSAIPPTHSDRASRYTAQAMIITATPPFFCRLACTMFPGGATVHATFPDTIFISAFAQRRMRCPRMRSRYRRPGW